MNADQLKNIIVRGLEDKKAEDIKVVDVSALGLSKYIILANGTSMRNVSAIADHITLEIKRNSNSKILVEGASSSNWVLLDLGDIIVHIFHPDTRIYYDLDNMYMN